MRLGSKNEAVWLKILVILFVTLILMFLSYRIGQISQSVHDLEAFAKTAGTDCMERLKNN